MWVKYHKKIDNAPPGVPVEVSDAFGEKLIKAGAEKVAAPSGATPKIVAPPPAAKPATPAAKPDETPKPPEPEKKVESSPKPADKKVDSPGFNKGKNPKS